MTLKEYIDSKGITAFALSKKTGIKYMTLYQNVNGLRDPLLEQAIIIADALEISLQELAELLGCISGKVSSEDSN